MNIRAIFFLGLAGLVTGCVETAGIATTGAATGAAATGAATAGANFGDVVVVMASDSMVGPSTADAATAARYYCSSRGKLAALESRQRPQELREPVLAEYSLMTFRCYTPNQ